MLSSTIYIRRYIILETEFGLRFWTCFAFTECILATNCVLIHHYSNYKRPLLLHHSWPKHLRRQTGVWTQTTRKTRIKILLWVRLGLKFDSNYFYVQSNLIILKTLNTSFIDFWILYNIVCFCWYCTIFFMFAKF